MKPIISDFEIQHNKAFCDAITAAHKQKSKYNNLKTLHLVLKSKWFDKIASGEKTSEYRSWKKYWNKKFTGSETVLVPHRPFRAIYEIPIVPFDKTLEILDKEVAKGKVGYFGKDSQANRVYYIHDKAGGGAAKMGQYLIGVVKRGHGARNDGIDNESKMPTITSNSWEQNNHILFGCITPDRFEKRQNGQRFNDGQKFYTLTAQDRHGVLVEGYIRKLTPVECERLQTLPDGWTGGYQIPNVTKHWATVGRLM